MLLVTDIGNTSVSYGFYEGGRLKSVGYCPSNDFPKMVIKLVKKIKTYPEFSMIAASVFPKITQKVKQVFRKTGIPDRLWIIGEDVIVPISHRYRNIKKLGSDRRVNVYGAIKLYQPPLLILDYGTAFTCDYISEKGVFLGGLIIPGPKISLEALSERGALLPNLKFPTKYSSFLGRDTKGGMKAGVLEGYGAMTDGLVERFRGRYGRRFQVIATGGVAKAIYPYTTQIDILDPHLTLKSLVRVFKDLVKLPS